MQPPLNLNVIDESSLLSAEQTIDEEEELLTSERASPKRSRTLRNLQSSDRSALTELPLPSRKRRVDSTQHGSNGGSVAMSLGLSDTFTPETADVLQGQVELGRSRLEDVRSWQQRIEAIQKDIDEYIDAVEPLAAAFDVPFDRNDSRVVAAAADRLVELLKEVQEDVRNRTDAEAELEDARRQLNDRKNDLQKADEELGRLLRSGGAADVENFRRAGRSFRPAGEPG